MAITHCQFHGQYPPTARFFLSPLLFEDIMDSSSGKLQEPPL
jgi:hypothetical protein